MDAHGRLLAFAESLIRQKTDTYCSELQRQILSTALQAGRKTYDQLAEDCGYSAKYVKQDVAPKLWQVLSQALDEKVTKSNLRAVLSEKMREAPLPQAVAGEGQRNDEEIDEAIASDLLGAHDLGADAAATPFAATVPFAAKPTILLVDDQPKNLRLLSELLEEQGYEVQQAISGSIALQAIARSKPHLILLDIYMPEMDGYLVCQQIKADSDMRSIPVIFISALDEAWDKVKAFSVGGSDYITKPFKVVEVLARVENQLKIQRLQQALEFQNTQLQQALKELQRLAAIDEVTQVASRSRFDEYLLACWQREMVTQNPLTLLMIQVNTLDDADGGDRCLRQSAQLINQVLEGPDDLLGRYGTLTFAAILPGQSAVEGRQIVHQLRGKIARLECIESDRDSSSDAMPLFNVGLSTIVPISGLGIGSFLEDCEQALQQAKAQQPANE
ncbi:MAG: response regulator [Cyanobacteria bacterium J06649_5]